MQRLLPNVRNLQAAPSQSHLAARRVKDPGDHNHESHTVTTGIMRSHLRTIRGGKVSFFLFMDTITAVTAMLILVSLMMTLYMGGSPLITADASKAKSARIEDTLGELSRVTAKNQTLRQLLDTANTAPTSKRLAVNVASLQSLISSQSSNLDQLHERMVRQVELARKTADKLGRGEEQERIEETKRQTEAERET